MAGAALGIAGRYAYANGNPYRYIDPDGRCGTDVPDQEDVAGNCHPDTSDASSLPSLADVLDTVDSTVAAAGPIGAEASGVEHAGVAAAEEVADVASRTIRGAAAVSDALGSATTATVFKTAHYGERLTKEAIDVDRAENVVGESIDLMRPSMSVGAEVRGRFILDDILLEYRAYLLPNGSVNVGTIFPVQP